MEEHIQQAMSDEILEDAAQRYGIRFADIVKIGGFENFVFGYTKDNQDYILRFVHSDHRTYDLVLAEIEFIDYLARNGASVSTVIHSNGDHIVERIPLPGDAYFSVSAFTKAPGDYVKPDDLTPQFYTMFGREVARLHNLSATFQPTHRRPHWYEENFHDIALRVLDESDREIIEAYDAIERSIRDLPQNEHNYGLIHTDLHFGNMYYDKKKLTFFDFDDSSYKHHLSDIAIILFYHFFREQLSDQEYNDQSRYILKHFLTGYRELRDWDMEFMRHINDFLQLRTVILYIVLVAAGSETMENPRRKAAMQRMRERVLNRSMDLDLDYVLRDL